MKILHTADWHIGKILHKESLEKDHLLFFEWMVDLISKEEIDVLLVAGDIFDIANPGAKDRALYYNVLSELSKLNIQVIITGGNHDSAGFLNAPHEILKSLNIQIVGGACDDIRDELVEVRNNRNELELVVAAVPFLKDKDLRRLDPENQYQSREELIREGIKNHYDQAIQLSHEIYPDIPVVGMGHLFAKGAFTSDSERDIHIGNAVGVGTFSFDIRYTYMALGHIHKPQMVDEDETIRFSGAPIPLSFSEKEDQKSVVIIEMDDKKLKEIRTIDIPRHRELKKFKGTLDEVLFAVENYKPTFILPSFVELEINEPLFNVNIISKVEALRESYKESEEFKILKSRTHFETGAKDTAELFTEGQNIEDLQPEEVFGKLIDQEELEDEEKKTLNEAFRELLETLEQ